jgi:hypothetical protein
MAKKQKRLIIRIGSGYQKEKCKINGVESGDGYWWNIALER